MKLAPKKTTKTTSKKRKATEEPEDAPEPRRSKRLAKKSLAKVPTTTGGVVKRKGKAQDVLKRWKSRAEARGQVFETGRFQTSAGPITIGHGFQEQRMTQGRKGDYEDETFGSLPPYAKLRKELPRSTAQAVYDPAYTNPPDATARQRLGTALSVGLPNVSEAQRAPGYDKYVRARARHVIAKPGSTDLFDPASNPAVTETGGGKLAREMMEMDDKDLHPDSKASILGYASDSSDDDEPRPGVYRKGLLKPIGEDK